MTKITLPLVKAKCNRFCWHPEKCVQEIEGKKPCRKSQCKLSETSFLENVKEILTGIIKSKITAMAKYGALLIVSVFLVAATFQQGTTIFRKKISSLESWQFFYGVQFGGEDRCPGAYERGHQWQLVEFEYGADLAWWFSKLGGRRGFNCTSGR